MGRKTYGRPFAPSSLCFVAGRDDVFVAGGNNAVQVWTFDPESRKLDNEYVGLGKLKRNIKNMMVRERERTRTLDLTWLANPMITPDRQPYLPPLLSL